MGVRTRLDVLLAAIDTADLIEELERRGYEATPTKQRQPVAVLPGLLVAPCESRVVYRGRAYQVFGRSMELLFALAVARQQGKHVLPAERLAAKVWRGWPKEESVPNLRSTVSYLRKVVPGVVGSRRGVGYWLNLDAQEQAA